MKKVLLSVILTLMFFSCSDSFLETENRNSLDVGSFFKTENDLSLAVNSAYAPLEGFGLFGQKYFMLFNTLDPYIWFETPNSGYDKMVFGLTDFDILWRDLYFGLYRTSDILANADRLNSVVDAAKLKTYKAQIMALRGMYNFYLVTLFNAPIYYDETNLPKDPLKGLANGTQEQFWNKIEEDLTYAAANLPVKWASSETGRITQGAANAQLGKALLYKHYHYYLRFGKGESTEANANLLKAKAALKKVIDGGAYHLVLPFNKTKSDYQAALLSSFSFINIPVGANSYTAENNAESVWEVQFNADSRGQSNYFLPGWWTGGNMLQRYFSPDPSSFRNLEIDPSLWNEFELLTSHPAGYTKDPRAYATCYLEGDTMDWRAGSAFNKGFVSGLNCKTTVFDNKLFQGNVPSKSIGLKKYYYPQYTGDILDVSPNNVRVIRYSDVLLMYAETSYQVDNDLDKSGLNALNEVRAKVDLPAVNTLTPEAIIHERNVEFAAEGLRYNDLIRWSFDPKFNIDLSVLFRGYFDKSKNYYFPIPQKEIDSNFGALKQNPGW